LARGQRRQRELGIRVALGISRQRLVGQLLLESLVLAAVGGVVGLLLAHWGGQMMRAVFLPEVAWAESPVNTRVLFATLALVGFTGLLAGMAPAWKGSRTGVMDSLKEGGRGGIHGRSTSQAFLLITQAALSVVLLVGAGLFVRSLDRAQGLELGLNPEGLILATLELDGEWEESARRDLSARAADRLEALPGVVSASFTTGIPFWSMSAFEFFVPGMDSIPAPPAMGPFVTAGSPNHLSTLGIQLMEGRMFSPQEAATGSRVAVVTENMAAGLWGEESALGQCFMVQDRESPCWEVVGVVEDSKLTGVTEEDPWQYFLPIGPTTGELDMGPRAIFIRTQGEARLLLSTVQQELKGLDSRIRFAHVRPFQELIEPELRSWRLGATMFSLFGLLALIVAMVGLYSVLAFNVARRTRELGVRAAMGASRTRLLSMVLRQALMVTGVGVSLGLLIAALAASRVGPLLFDTSPRDPLVLGGAALALLLVAVVAGALPAWAASRVDPMGALRTE
jgi:predicted permease